MAHRGHLVTSRDDPPGWTDLAVGEPVLLREMTKVRNHLGLDVGGWDLDYPALGGERYLVDTLLEAGFGPRIVVACGARQALAAAIYAFRVVRGVDLVHHDAPYWPGWPEVVRHGGSMFVTDPDAPELSWRSANAAHVEAFTTPNNPDGRCDRKNGPHALWDAAYACPAYDWYFGKGSPSNATTSVWSASKLFGVSGLRVGWISTPDGDLADAAADYVESTTSGASTVSQAKVGFLVKGMGDGEGDGVNWAASRMLINGQSFKSLLGRYCDEICGVPAGQAGMFAWFRVKPELVTRFGASLERAKVRAVPGEACGMPAGSGWWRLSMGNLRDVTDKALEAVAKEMATNA